MSLKQSTVTPPAAPVPREGARPAERGPGLAGLLLVVIGALLLTLAAGGVLADSVRGGTDALRGTDRGERLAGFGGNDGIRGLAGDDELYGGEGSDVILGGAGDDFIETKDGKVDFVGCGSGDDVASVDLSDRVARDCETLYPG
ncbi:MAG: hypothetical protein M3514_15770 [Actinomycetota bacterium]|nr:hypothetical protein [Actinomycetota bacterium]